ncbi:hypothetical protein NKG94_03935 [Micromonospora sp. M12]
MLTGHLSARDQPWLGDHVVQGAVIVPGAALTELALHAADRAGAEGLAELTHDAPLRVPADARVALQLRAGPADPDGGARSASTPARPAKPGRGTPPAASPGLPKRLPRRTRCGLPRAPSRST